MFKPDFGRIETDVLATFQLKEDTGLDRMASQLVVTASQISRKMLEEYHKQLMDYLSEK